MNAIRRKTRGPTTTATTSTANPTPAPNSHPTTSAVSSSNVPPQHPHPYPHPHPHPHPRPSSSTHTHTHASSSSSSHSHSHPSSPSPSPSPAAPLSALHDRRSSHPPMSMPQSVSVAASAATAATASNLADRYGSFDGYGSFFPPAASTPQPAPSIAVASAVLPNELSGQFSSLAVSAPASGAATPPQAHSPSHHFHVPHHPHLHPHSHRHAASISSFAALDGYPSHKEKLLIHVRDVRLLIVVSANDLVASIVNEAAYQYSILFPSRRNAPIDVSSCLIVDDHGTYIPLVYAVSDVVGFYSSQQVYPPDPHLPATPLPVSPVVPCFRLIEPVPLDDEDKYQHPHAAAASRIITSQQQQQARDGDDEEPDGPLLHDEDEDVDEDGETNAGDESISATPGAIAAMSSRRTSQIDVHDSQHGHPPPSLQSPSASRPSSLSSPPNSSFTLTTARGEGEQHR